MNKYNTTIDVLGGMDINYVFDTIDYFDKTRDNHKTMGFFIEDNPFGLKITSSRKRYFAVLKKIYLSSFNQKDGQLFINTISHLTDIEFKKKILFLETCRQDRLFHDITTILVQKKYKENHRIINSREIYVFLKGFNENTTVAGWADDSLKRISRKYITFMKKLGFFQKESRLNSIIAYPLIEVELIVYLTYLLKFFGLSDNQVFQSSLFQALLLGEEEKVDLLKNGSLAGFYQFSFSGDGKAEFTLSYTKEELIHEFSKKYG